MNYMGIIRSRKGAIVQGLAFFAMNGPGYLQSLHNSVKYGLQDPWGTQIAEPGLDSLLAWPQEAKNWILENDALAAAVLVGSEIKWHPINWGEVF